MDAMGAVPSDRRGWVLCLVSAAACVFGACIVCVDIFIRLLPGKKDFRIQDSNAFLSGSLSLSFGVMIFSALFSMLPSAKRYLVRDGLSEQTAGLFMMAAFVVGFAGIQIISRIIHRFMPSHVVDCDHSHDDEACNDSGAARRPHTHPHNNSTRRPSRRRSSVHAGVEVNEASPLLARIPTTRRRPSMKQVRHRVLSFVKDTRANCDEFGPCFGYSDPCGQECRKHVISRTPSLRAFPLPPRHTPSAAVNTQPSTPTTLAPIAAQSFPPWHPSYSPVPEETASPMLSDVDNVLEIEPEPDVELPRTRNDALIDHDVHDLNGHVDIDQGTPTTYGLATASNASESPSAAVSMGSASVADPKDHRQHNQYDGSGWHRDLEHPQSGAEEAPESPATTGASAPHHHHVPANAFMSIGVQTVLAIGLHKFPEGFITFATNHANPALGLSVFLALFVHNIAEGFSMALPLYMALGSRMPAILWASALGGLSQPLGAAMAALWLRYLGRGCDGDDGAGANGTAYGLLFAVTGGIMVSVALQLFVESLTLHHNRQLNIAFGFAGMLLMGVSSALVQHD